MTELLVCVKCKTPEPGAGRRLYDAISAPDGVVKRAVGCLQNCDQGCSFALRGGDGKWAYVYGNGAPDLAEVISHGAALYHDTADGLIPWRQRPEHLKRNCVARIPPADFPDPLEDE